MGILSVLGTTFRAIGFTARVTANVASSTLNGAVEVMQTTADALDAVHRKDWEGLENLVEKRTQQLGRALEAKFQAADELWTEADACMQNPRRKFFTKRNAARTAMVATTAAGLLAGASLIDADDAVASDAADALSGGFFASDLTIENGVFAGGADELDALIGYGELENTEHLSAEEIQRDLGARDAFLSMHGYSAVPDGMEVHHVVPLCEGGADDPSNMILVSQEEHAEITAAHSRYYGW